MPLSHRATDNQPTSAPSQLSTNIKLINDNQSTVEWRCLLQIIISNQLISVKLRQHALGVQFFL